MATSSFNRHFPGYEILGELGRGNARVLKARHQLNHELAAIKHFALNTDASTLRRFQQESEIMTAIKHRNIVRIRDVQLEAELPYIVMELVEDGDLRGLLHKRGTLDPKAVIELGLQLGAAFRAIHTAGIVHRDVKPENIMLRILPGGGFHFLLTDFGIATLRERESTLTGAPMMTYEYASPEQFDNPKAVGLATDYYALGVVLYECVTGRVPFQFMDGRLHTLMKQVMDEAPPPLQAADAYLPPALVSLIEKLLRKDARERLQDPAALDAMLREASRQAESGRHTPPPPPPNADSRLTMPAPQQDPRTGGSPRRKTADAPPVSRPQPPRPVPPATARPGRGKLFRWAAVLVCILLVAVWYDRRRTASQQAQQENLPAAVAGLHEVPDRTSGADAVPAGVDSRIGRLLSRYYQLSQGDHCEELAGYFVPVADFYYQQSEYSRPQIIAACETYNARWSDRESTPDPESMRVTIAADRGYNVRYQLTHRYRKTPDAPWSAKRITMYVHMNTDLSITSILETRRETIPSE